MIINHVNQVKRLEFSDILEYSDIIGIQFLSAFKYLRNSDNLGNINIADLLRIIFRASCTAICYLHSMIRPNFIFKFILNIWIYSRYYKLHINNCFNIYSFNWNNEVLRKKNYSNAKISRKITLHENNFRSSVSHFKI